ncbi:MULTISPECIES: helix-turn-helix domain-containing protein [unclassified Streptomyces]|uniref:helix-turn-helix domain-containing protein n=1 Tax=unclassified Streptomyces TaxID=2593676 RepID=UPI00344D160C
MTLERRPPAPKGPGRHRQGLACHEAPARAHTPAEPPSGRTPLLPGTTSAAFTRLNARGAERVGVGPAAYAGLLGMAPEHLLDDRYRVPASTNIRIWELMTLRVPWHEASWHMAQESALGALGIWDYLITQAPTPLEGLRDAARYLATAGDAGTEVIHIEETERYVTVSHVNGADLSDDVASAIRAYSLGLFRQRVGEAGRRAVVPTGVALAARAPRTHQALVRLYGTRAIDFESPVNSLTFEAADLTTPQHHAPGLSDLLRSHAEQALAEAIPLHDWLSLFRATLRATADTETPSLRVVSRRMALSTRTLQRRIEERGSTWSEELQALRRERALHLLTTTDTPFDAVARQVGYADPGGLRRAMKRWTGQAPAELRARNGTGSDGTCPPPGLLADRAPGTDTP